jgi:aminoglycoside 3-N-acetyltransferase I
MVIDRRQGIASALIHRLGNIAAERGARLIYVQADYDDAAAIGLYHQYGVGKDVMHFDIDVPNKIAGGIFRR